MEAIKRAADTSPQPSFSCKLPKMEPREKSSIKVEASFEEGKRAALRSACDQRSFRKIAFPFSQIRHLRGYPVSRILLSGCLLACKMRGTETVIVDEISLLNHKIIAFKHSLEHYLVDDLDDVSLTKEIYENWIADMAKWDESLSVFEAYEKRRKAVYEERREKTETEKQSEKAKRKTDAQLEEGEIAGSSSSSSQGQSQTERTEGHGSGQRPQQRDGHTDGGGGEEPPLDAQVHSKDLLRQAVFPYSELLYVAKKGAEKLHPLVLGCLTACSRDIPVPPDVRNNKKEKSPPPDGHLNKKVIVDEVFRINKQQITFKHSPTVHYSLDDWQHQSITEQVFHGWIDDLARRDVQLPLFEKYRRRRETLFQLKRDNDFKWPKAAPAPAPQPTAKPPKPRTFVQTFGADILSCFVNPWHLVHLQLLGPAAFEKVAIGLYVRCKVGRCCSVECIKRVTWNANQSYVVYGQPMNVLLHFYGPSNTPPAPISAIQFPNCETDRQVVEYQQKYRTFVAPSGNHIARKSQELQNALYSMNFFV